MSKNYKFNDENLEELVRENKINTFDSISVVEKKIRSIEGAISEEEDKEKQAELNNIWLDLNAVLRNMVSSTDLFAEAIEQLDSTEVLLEKYALNETESIIAKEDAISEVSVEPEEIVDENAASIDSADTNPDLTPSENDGEVVNEEQPVVGELPEAEAPSKTETEDAKEEIPPVETATEEVTPAIKLPVISDEEEKVEVTPSPEGVQVEDNTTYEKTSQEDDKAISITTEQGDKLRASYDVQNVVKNAALNGEAAVPEAEKETPETTPTEATSSEVAPSQEELAKMVEQIPELYAQGKTEEALAMSNKISEMNKQLQKTA